MYIYLVYLVCIYILYIWYVYIYILYVYIVNNLLKKLLFFPHFPPLLTHNPSIDLFFPQTTILCNPLHNTCSEFHTPKRNKNHWQYACCPSILERLHLVMIHFLCRRRHLVPHHHLVLCVKCSPSTHPGFEKEVMRNHTILNVLLSCSLFPQF